MLTELPELAALQRIVELGAAHLQCRTVCEVEMAGGGAYPVQVVTLGNPDPAVPAVGFFGGVHGLERIGAEVVLAHLHSLVMRMQWDSTLHRQLESLRLVFMPLVNPGGMAMGTRANPRGVDLMRNAPVQALEQVPFLVGGQRWSARLPWKPKTGQFAKWCSRSCSRVRSAWRWIATPALAPPTGFGFRTRTPVRRFGTWPKCMP